MNNPLSLPCAIGAWEGEGEWVDDLGTQGLHPALYYAAPTGLHRAKMPPLQGYTVPRCRINAAVARVLFHSRNGHITIKSIASCEGGDAVDKI